MAFRTWRRLGLLVALGVAMPALADSKAASPDAPGADKADAPAADKKVCRSIESTGSMLTHRICHTRAEWRIIDGQNGKEADHFRATSQSDFGGERPQ